MTTTRRHLLQGIAAGSLALPLSARLSPAHAAWPTDKPIRLVVPFAPAGPADVVARIVAQGLGEAMSGSTVIVENKAGAGGNIGFGQVARAEPDGYTLLVVSSALHAEPEPVRQRAVRSLQGLCAGQHDGDLAQCVRRRRQGPASRRSPT